MKVLGLSFGKKNANTDILVKEALYGAKEAYPDAEINFINTQRLNIGRCIGCGACSTALEKGKDNDCIIKDDFQMVENAVREADAIILGAPVYVLQPVGQFKDFVDRFSCRHDVSAINWVSMGTATLHLFGFPAMMKVVANYNANSMGTIGNPYLNEEMIGHMHEIGKRTVAAVDMDDKDVEFYGPKGTGTCPVCHQNLLTVNGTTTVECPICGIEGKISIDGDKLNVEFSEAQQARARGTFAGLREHTTEIQGFGAICGPKIMANKELLEKKMERVKKFDEMINA